MTSEAQPDASTDTLVNEGEGVGIARLVRRDRHTREHLVEAGLQLLRLCSKTRRQSSFRFRVAARFLILECFVLSSY